MLSREMGCLPLFLHWGLVISLLCWRKSATMRRGEKNGARLLTSHHINCWWSYETENVDKSPHHLFSSFTCSNIILQFGMPFLLCRTQQIVILIWYHNSKVLQEAVKTCFFEREFLSSNNQFKSLKCSLALNFLLLLLVLKSTKP